MSGSLVYSVELGENVMFHVRRTGGGVSGFRSIDSGGLGLESTRGKVGRGVGSGPEALGEYAGRFLSSFGKHMQWSALAGIPGMGDKGVWQPGCGHLGGRDEAAGGPVGCVESAHGGVAGSASVSSHGQGGDEGVARTVGGSDDGGQDSCDCGAGAGFGADGRNVGVPVKVEEECDRGVDQGLPPVVWTKSKRRREKLKEKKRQRCEVDGFCSLGAVVDQSAVERSGKQGFFSMCSTEVQSKLRESRALRLIAENEAAEVAAKRKVDSAKSPGALANEVIRVVDIANRLRRSTAGTEVGGWAETVASSMTRSVAESAPSSVPSLASVGYGKSSTGSDTLVSVDVSPRLAEYNSRVAAAKLCWDELLLADPDDLVRELDMLRKEYADVAYSPGELAMVKLQERVTNGIASMDLTMEQKMEVFDLFVDYDEVSIS